MLQLADDATMHSACSRRALTIAAACAATLPYRRPAAAVEVETKSPFITLFKNLLPDDSPTVAAPSSPLDSIEWDAQKRRGLSTERMAEALSDGLIEREWFVTGKGLPQLFSDSFTFSDPDVSLAGFEPYCRQVRRLFDQETARAELVCCSVTAPNTITVLWRNAGKVTLGPLKIELKPYLVTTTLRTDPADGLVVSQVDDFVADGLGLLLYQVPLLRPLTSPAVASVDVLKTQCDFTSCAVRPRMGTDP